MKFYNLVKNQKVYNGDYGRVTKFFRAGESDTSIDNGQVLPISIERTFNHFDENLLYDEVTEEAYLAFIESRSSAIARMRQEAETRVLEEQQKASQVFADALIKLGLSKEDTLLVLSALNLQALKQAEPLPTPITRVVR